ncbi:hypothetical protein WZ78_08455 [Leuconostoc mesenteroides subsp. dextranicum]|jgi:hypothetical protein|uniref:hypothetical protein n=1 Tax=Leuconostoc TaxID=1243 RepID=UPI000681FEBA|nr:MULTISPECIES: hypothetical protein [Leuconostoc]KMY77063.1 hypothetical protein WZ79_09370 [Leuconostoc mesenteroides subsp. mesenteroides]KMY80918.1 hypothetical protein WZ78_08455 [Leuconostoc mesenteroides subsp. dextranicum]MBZ1503503.1 hypothetical protein [Leuconostoc mesenteroides]MBZ1507565.1 hypothetical protein [Leuconostoc mesenteroides]MBZ5997000.1 hypothetical protein [Leuconostoc gasicomitatum]
MSDLTQIMILVGVLVAYSLIVLIYTNKYYIRDSHVKDVDSLTKKHLKKVYWKQLAVNFFLSLTFFF